MKKLITTFATLTFVIGLSLTTAAAKTIDCEIISSKGDTVTLNCGKKANTFKVGDSVQVKKKPEGC
ncbi:MAG: hypothetical protein KKD73_14200 [Proteobacteria bacterium]|nr:hypothetical protein [Pseudomonadota bacterium]MBU1639375.1 hypothetical protein [Pseudomonadota bacterium]